MSAPIQGDAYILGRNGKPSNGRAFAIFLAYEALLFCLFYIAAPEKKTGLQVQHRIVSLAPMLLESLKSSRYSCPDYTNNKQGDKDENYSAMIGKLSKLLLCLKEDDIAWLACGCKEIYLLRGQQFIKNKQLARLQRLGRFKGFKKSAHDIASHFFKPATHDLLEPVSGETDGLDRLAKTVASEFEPKCPNSPAAQKVLKGLEALNKTYLAERAAYRGKAESERQYYQYGKNWSGKVNNALNAIIPKHPLPITAADPKVFERLAYSYLTMQLRSPDDRHEIPNRMTFNEINRVYKHSVRQNCCVITELASLFGSFAYWIIA